MKKIDIKILVIIVLITITVALIIINLDIKNKNILPQEIAKEQLGETTKDNAYVTLSTHMSELNEKEQQINNMQKLVYLGSGTSFDLTTYEGYQNFTNDNFIICSIDNLSDSGSSEFAPYFTAKTPSSVSAQYITTKSYDSSTGILTAYVTFSASFGRNGGTTSGSLPKFSSKQSVSVYLIN